MIITRRFSWRLVFAVAFRPVLFSAAWAGVVFALYAFADLRFLRVPFLPIATIGTAVAFYVGFKNNSSYNRFWEGRKIWGGIVNESRTWAVSALAYVDAAEPADDTDRVRRDLVYRHLAWVNALRLQLRKKSRFLNSEYRAVRRRMRNHAEHMRNDWDRELTPFLSADELAAVSAQANPASHLLKAQSQRLASLHASERLDLFRQLQMMDLIRELYALQGKCERIKNTPFPRQYAEFSRWFTRAFVFLMPFGLLDVFGTRIDAATTSAQTLLPVVPMFVAASLITWVFTTMEGIGDASEDPFERSMNDVPMNALCRTIEIDLRQMLGETEVPEPEKPAGFVMY